MIYRATANTVFRETDGQGIALNLESEQYYTMNEMGTRIWVLLQEKDSIDEIVELVEAEYEVAREQIEADLASFLADLQANGLIEQP